MLARNGDENVAFSLPPKNGNNVMRGDFTLSGTSTFVSVRGIGYSKAYFVCLL